MAKNKSPKVSKDKVEPFDYSLVNDDHQNAIREVFELLKQHDLENSDLAKELTKRFNFDPPKQYNIKNSLFVQCCEKAGVWYSNQGHIKQGDIEYPLIAVQDDTRKLDEIVKVAVQLYLENTAKKSKEE